jgi:flagellar hook-associated protein 3 FlgL
MKVATRTIYENIAANLFKSAEKLQSLNESASSGKRITQPSDDPVGAATVLDIQTVLGALAQYKTNISGADSQLKASESVMTSVNDLLTTAKELAAQMSNETYSAQDRRAAASQVENLTEEIRQLANTQLNGSYLFSGYSTNEAAVTDGASLEDPVANSVNLGRTDGVTTVNKDGTGFTGSVPANTHMIKFTATRQFQVSTDGGSTWSGNYDTTGGGNVTITDGIVLNFDDVDFTAGDEFTVPVHQYRINDDDNSIEVNVGRSATIKKNVTAVDAFQYGSGKTVFDALDDLRTALLTNNTNGIADSLTALTGGQDNLQTQLADVGARLNRTQARSDLIDAMNLQNEQRRSDIEDVDIVEVMTQLQSQQVAYQAALLSSARISQVSLVNYLSS